MSPHPSRPTVLVLEDDMLLAMDMEDHLLQFGFAVAGPFARVNHALEAIKTTSLAGAVLDLNLNGELSFPVIETLKANGIPVIVCSGYAELPGLRGKLGDIPLLAKPLNPIALKRLVLEIFEPVGGQHLD